MDQQLTYGLYYQYNLGGGSSSYIVEKTPYITNWESPTELYLDITTHIPILEGYKFIGYNIRGLIDNSIINTNTTYYSGDRINLYELLDRSYFENQSKANYVELELIARYELIHEYDELYMIAFDYNSSPLLDLYHYTVDHNNMYDKYDKKLGYVIPASLQSPIILYSNMNDEFIDIKINNNTNKIRFSMGDSNVDYADGIYGSGKVTIIGYSYKEEYQYSVLGDLINDVPYRVDDYIYSIKTPINNKVTLYAVYIENLANRVNGTDSYDVGIIKGENDSETIISSYIDNDIVVYDLSAIQNDDILFAGYSFNKDDVTPDYHPNDFVMFDRRIIRPLYELHSKSTTKLKILFESLNSVSNIPEPIEFNTVYFTQLTIPRTIPIRDGYIFAGWFNNQDSKTYYPSDKCVVHLSEIDKETIITFSSKWEIDTSNNSTMLMSAYRSNSDISTLNSTIDYGVLKQMMAEHPFQPLYINKSDCCELLYKTKDGDFLPIM